ncbi:MAG TPA: 30S ribosomal protein S6 [Candidatus Binatia bacterium]|jgi:small subunit ribosomal protein S6|nr:30S ribosomal protein S6 [Candidatus Binatia bacterium]
MEKYELLYIIAAKYTDAEIEGLMEKIKGLIASAGGNVTEMHNLGRRKLAYPISHVRNGNYVLVYFEAEPEALAKLNEMLRLSADVLRHLVTSRSPYLNKIPSFAELVEIRGEGDDQPRPRPIQQVVQAPAIPAQPVTMEELDKKLDEILTEEVL